MLGHVQLFGLALVSMSNVFALILANLSLVVDYRLVDFHYTDWVGCSSTVPCITCTY